jgi:hypothetical protein
MKPWEEEDEHLVCYECGEVYYIEEGDGELCDNCLSEEEI